MSGPLEERLRNLPDRPGCYRFLDANGRVLYVGKATSLRSRVRSYFVASGLKGRNSWVERMIPEVRDIEVMVTQTSLEALLLECTLIKQHRPPHNIRLTDDKHYPYLRLTWSELFPRLLVVRRIEGGKDEYFGPYSSSRPMRHTLDIIRRIFGPRSCNLDLVEGYTREPCLQHHLGYCPAPCAGLISAEDYRATMKRVARFLRGHADEVLRDLQERMETASKRLEFEKAALFRDQVRAIERTVVRQDVILPDLTDHDVIGIHQPEGEQPAMVSILFLRGGRLVDSQPFTLRRAEGRERAELVGDFLTQYYSRAAFVPKDVLVPEEPPDVELLAEWLSTKRGSKVRIHVPQRGEKRRLVALAEENASHAARREAERERLEARRGFARLEALGESICEPLGIAGAPRRIECYDISTLQGKQSVASMVVFIDGRPARGEYRSFVIRSETGKPDDVGMMRETLTRRFVAWEQEHDAFREPPDLVVVDGGKPQLNCALAVFEELRLSFPLISLAKREEEVFLPGHSEPLVLAREDEGLKLLMHIRDEAHRSAITHHRKRRSDALTRSVLDDIPGVGPKRKAALLTRFASMRALLDATVDEIAAVDGMTVQLAQRIQHAMKAPGMSRSRNRRRDRAPTPTDEKGD